VSQPVIALVLAIVLAVLPRAARPAEAGPDVQVLEAYTAPTARRQTTADVYARFVNVESDDRLVGADSALGGRVILVTAEGAPLPYPTFGFREDVETGFREGGPHLRLTGLKKPLVRGQSFPVILHFESGGALTLTVVVQ
jgi:copper(I)-binding protein